MTMLALRSLSTGLGLTPQRGARAPSIVLEGLLAEWRFADGFGQQLTDHSGNGHHGTLGTTADADANDPAWGSSPLRLDFDGDDVVVSDDIATAGEVHVDLIVRLDPATASFGIPLAQFSGSNNASPFQIFRNGTNDNMFYRIGLGGSRLDLTGSIDAFDGGWHHISLDVKDDDGAQVSVRIDGTLDAADSSTSSMVSATDTVVFGARNESVDLPFVGAQAYVLMYGLSLDAQQQQQNRDFLKDVMAERGVILP